MKEQDSKGTEQELEEEIDEAIDSLFVEKEGGGEKPPPSPVSSAVSPEPPQNIETDLGSPAEKIEEEIDEAIDSLFVDKGVDSGKPPSPVSSGASPEPLESPEMDLGSPAEKLEDETDQSIDSLFVEKEEGGEKTPSPVSSGASPGPLESPEMDLGSPAEKLEDEIDQSIDSRFVQKGTGSEGVQSVASTVKSAESLETPEVKLEAPAPNASVEVPSADREPGPESTQGPMRNLENLETHLLSLEWEISPDLIDKVISELGFLKDAYDNDPALFQVFEMMSNVAHALADDEGNITPDNLRFLLEAKDGIKLLINELKGKEAYRNVVLSGILAKHHLMQERREGPIETTDQTVERKDVEGLTETLKTLSHELQKEIRQLFVITQKLRTGNAHSTPSETVGMLLMTSSGRVFAIEKDLVLRSVQIPYRMVRTVWKDNEIRIRGDRFPLVNLFRLFKFRDRVEPKEKAVVLIRKDDRTLAVLVDRLLQKREVPAGSIREEKSLAYLRGTAPIGKGRKMYLLDTDRLMVEF